MTRARNIYSCYFKALQIGDVNKVVLIDKLSILVTVAFGYFILHEKLKKQSAIGLAMIVAGTLSLLVWVDECHNTSNLEDIDYMRWQDKGTVIAGRVMGKDDIVGHASLQKAEELGRGI